MLAIACFATMALRGADQAAAAEPNTGPRCWSLAELAAVPAERAPVKGNHTFDAPLPKQALAPFSSIPDTMRGAIRRVKLPDGKKLVALTFDLCEQPGEIAGYDGAILDYLRANGIKATFFAGGKWTRSHAERAKQIAADPLFEIGNHSEAHRNLRTLSGAALESEVVGPQAAYEHMRAELMSRQCVQSAPKPLAAIPVRLSLFRFPYGACDARSLQAVNNNGLLVIQWDLSTGDPSPAQSAKAIAGTMVRNTRPGSIIVAHANGRGVHTAEALPLAVPQLKALGFEFVTVSELLAAGTPEIVPTCYDRHPGDTDRYDHPFALSLPRKEKSDHWAPSITP